MDGHFVPVITFGPRVVSSFADLVHERGGTIDVHLMIEQPERQIPEFAKAGADSCTVHVETCPHLHQTIRADPRARHDRGRDAQPGDAGRGRARGGARRRPAAVHVGQSRAGAARASSRPRSSASRELTELLRPGMGLEVDGGVGPATIERCRSAGANLMVAGSAIYDQPSPAEAWKALTALAGA